MFILINKPSGPTSHDVIDKMRKITGIKKIGHSGTLDPFASGLLLVAIGRESTREISKFVKLDKEYIADLKLGAVSDSYDRTGMIKLFNSEHPFCHPELGSGSSVKSRNKFGMTRKVCVDRVAEVLQNFIGKQEQIPPMFSAKKVNGKKLYELARKGIEIKRKPSQIEIYKIEILPRKISRDPLTPLRSAQDDILKLKISCASGTYIRTLANDIGKALGCGAYLQELERTKIGDYKLENAVVLEKLNSENWQKFCFQSC